VYYTGHYNALVKSKLFILVLNDAGASVAGEKAVGRKVYVYCIGCCTNCSRSLASIQQQIIKLFDVSVQ